MIVKSNVNTGHCRDYLLVSVKGASINYVTLKGGGRGFPVALRFVT